MSGPKKWVSSKVRKATRSSSSISGSHQSNSSLSGNSLVGSSSPPVRLPPTSTPTSDTAYLEFGSGSTLAARAGTALAGTYGSSSSIETNETGLTPSPSTTPPKKTWERNYKSFLKRAGRPPASSAASALPNVPKQDFPKPQKKQPPVPSSSMPPPVRSLSENATIEFLKDDPLFAAGEDPVFDLRPSLVDGFPPPKSSLLPSTTNQKQFPIAPSSPIKPALSTKEPASKGTSLFRSVFRKSENDKMNSKTKSVDSLDSSMRRGLDRKSSVGTPSTRCIEDVSPRTSSAKATFLPPAVMPPVLTSEQNLKTRTQPCEGPRSADFLDQVLHNGQIRLTSNVNPNLLSRIASVGSAISTPHKPPSGPETGEEELIKERKKAFTDFHNMGIDSSSAYLGDDPSLHKTSVFLSSMAYPTGSAGGKVRIRPKHALDPNGPHSMDPIEALAPSANFSSVSGIVPVSNEPGGLSPERALQPLDGPERWTKGERHAIIPAILSMCPIQVLNKIMSSEGGGDNSPVTSGANCGEGIGSMISEDDAMDSIGSNGWFLGENHHHAVSMSTSQRGGVGNIPSAFGKIVLGKAVVASLGMRSFLSEVYGWCTGVFVLRQNFLFEYRETDNLNGLPWGYALLQSAEVYPHKHFINALHLDFFEKPCSKSGKRSLLIRVDSREERDRWISLLHAAARMTIYDLYDVDESDGSPEFGRGRYATVRPAKRKGRRRGTSFSESRYPLGTPIENFRNVSNDSLNGYKSCHNEFPTEYDCALKIVDKKEFWARVKKERERADTLVREAAVQTTLAVQGRDSPGFLRLRSIFETGEQLVMELELLKGNDLFQHISLRGILDEVEAAHIMRDLLNCLNIMSQIGVAHRDIKPANLLMCDENDGDIKVKLADFGMASFVGVDNLVRGRCGTPGFVAPEILTTGANGGYGNKVDIFSAGVTLYVMLVGYEPFYGETDEELINANKDGKVDFPYADWHTVSVEGRDLIERMLEINPSKRIEPSEALRHPWITRRAPELDVPHKEERDFQIACSTC